MELVLGRRVSFGLPATGMVTLMALLAVINVVVPAADAFVVASSGAIDLVRGGLNWVGIIDTSCSITAVGALFLAANPYAVAFCAGWGLGKLVGEWW